MLCYYTAVVLLFGPRWFHLVAQTAADTVVFVNDEKLSGKLLSASSGGIVFKSTMAGELKISWDNVKELRSAKSFAVIPKEQKLTKGNAEGLVPKGQLMIVNKEVEVKGASTDRKVPLSQVDQIVEGSAFDRAVTHSPGILGGWSGAISAGASLVRATQNSTTFTGSVNLVRIVPGVDWLPARNRTIIDYNQAYGTTSQPLNPTIKTNIFHAGAERDEYISKRLYLFGAATFDHNFSQGLNLQQQYGGGLGYTVLKSVAQQLDVKADVHYEKQDFFSPSTQLNLFGSTFDETYLRTLPRAIVFNEFASLSPSWNDTNAYSARLGANLTFPVYRGFAFNVGAIDDYLNNAPAAFKKNSVTFTGGVAYTFKQR